MPFRLYILFIVTNSLMFSCDRIGKKGEKAFYSTKDRIRTTKEKVERKSWQAFDRILPVFDSDTPDPEFNKKRFTAYLNVPLTADVECIYAYGDFWGADYKVLISFKCNITTINSIINAKSMTLSKDRNDEELFFMDEFPWWNKKDIAKIIPFKAGKENESWEYLWYDNRSNIAYYEAFSL